MASFQSLPPELVAEILNIVVHSSRRSLTNFRSTANPTLYLHHSPVSGDEMTSIATLGRVCSLWYNTMHLNEVLPPMSAEDYLRITHSTDPSNNPPRDTGALDLCVVVSGDDAREFTHGTRALDTFFKSPATSRLRSLLLKDLSPEQTLLELFQAVIDSEAVDLPLLGKIELQFGKIDDVWDDRQTKTVNALARSLALLSTLAELYWYSEDFVSPEIPWAHLKTVFLHSKFSLRTTLACLELCTSAVTIGIEGIDGWAERSDNAGEHAALSFLLLPNLKHLTLEGKGNIFVILDHLSLPAIESIQIILRHPISRRGKRIACSTSIQRFLYRHQHPIPVTVKVQAEQARTTDQIRGVCITSSGQFHGAIDVKEEIDELLCAFFAAF